MTVMKTWLKYWRNRAGLTQLELAERSGTTQALISDIENGKPCTIRTLSRLSAALDIRLQDLRLEWGVEK